jgi:hypothetical protein
VDENANFKRECPSLHFTVPDTLETVQQLGKLNKTVLLRKAEELFNATQDPERAVDFVREHAPEHARPAILFALGKYLAAEKGTEHSGVMR